MDEVVGLDREAAGLRRTEAEVARVGKPDVDVYAWLTDTGPYNGYANRGAACGGASRTSLTMGPTRGIIETAEVCKQNGSTIFDSY